jgi:hypothetical protein
MQTIPNKSKQRKSTRGNRGGARNPAISLPGDGKVMSDNFVLKSVRHKNLVITERVLSTGIVNTLLPQYGALSFTVNTLPSIAFLSNMFDLYKIHKVEVNFTSVRADNNPSSVGSVIPKLQTIIDLDDDVAPTSTLELDRYSTLVEVRGVNSVRRVFKPRASMQLYLTAVTSAYAVAPDVWLDLAYTTVPHYGCKWSLGASGVAGYYAYDIEVVMTAEFANQR